VIVPLRITVGSCIVSFGKKLGHGTYGLVHLAKYQNQDVAVKMFNYRNNWQVLKECEDESVIMQTINRLHIPHVVELYASIKLGTQFFMLMTYMPNGALGEWINNKTPFDQPLRYKIACQITAAIKGLHRYHILHRDIKSMNILLDENFNAKLADFGTAKIGSNEPELLGTPAWMAPEVIIGGPHTKASDVFGFTRVLWELFAWSLPFRDLNFIQIFEKTLNGENEEVPETCPDKIKALIRWGLLRESRSRPTAKMLLTELESDMDTVSGALKLQLRT
jgi:serine/threonine protein kinase